MEDRSIFSRIDELVEEEHRLRSAVQAGLITSDDERVRLREVEESLDQCWDLLRRRRAARDVGADPQAVTPQPIDQVESYLQ